MEKKLLIRDDDVNFHYSPHTIEKYYSKIWNKFPVILFIVPNIRGNYFEYTAEANKPDGKNLGYNYLKNSRKCYRICENAELINFITHQILCGNVAVGLHGFNHFNEKVGNILPNNYAFGADFFTNDDIVERLSHEIRYLNSIFNVDIKDVSAPQNLISLSAYNQISDKGYNIFSDLPFFSFGDFWRKNFFNVIYNRFLAKFNDFDNSMVFSGPKLNQKSTLQGLLMDIQRIYERSNCVYLGTHCSGFDLKLDSANMTVGDLLIELVCELDKMGVKGIVRP